LVREEIIYGTDASPLITVRYTDSMSFETRQPINYTLYVSTNLLDSWTSTTNSVSGDGGANFFFISPIAWEGFYSLKLTY
jgi:hypothetical protein